MEVSKWNRIDSVKFAYHTGNMYVQIETDKM